MFGNFNQHDFALLKTASDHIKNCIPTSATLPVAAKKAAIQVHWLSWSRIGYGGSIGPLAAKPFYIDLYEIMSHIGSDNNKTLWNKTFRNSTQISRITKKKKIHAQSQLGCLESLSLRGNLWMNGGCFLWWTGDLSAVYSCLRPYDRFDSFIHELMKYLTATLLLLENNVWISDST